MFPVKLMFNHEVRRVQIPLSEGSKVVRFSELLHTAKSLFPAIRPINPESVSFIWEDEEGDRISCSSDEEIAEAVRVLAELQATFKFIVSVSETPEVSRARTTGSSAPSGSGPVHGHVTCDGCGMFPIVGARFKCAVREDFDLCEACEAKHPQPHPMVKIYSADQSPAAIIVAVHDEGASPQPDFSHCGRDRGFGRRHWGWGHGRRQGGGGGCRWRAGGGGGDKYGKYSKMMACGLPEAAVRQRMTVDGYSDVEIRQFFESAGAAHAEADSANQSARCFDPLAPRLKKFARMRSCGLPEAAVRQRMTVDGYSEDEINKFFASLGSVPSWGGCAQGQGAGGAGPHCGPIGGILRHVQQAFGVDEAGLNELVENFFQAAGGEEGASAAAPPSAPTGEDAVDQQILESVLRESLGEVPVATAVPAGGAEAQQSGVGGDWSFASVASAPAPAPVSAPAPAPPADSFAVWDAELRALAEMGFHARNAAVVDLLVEHCKWPGTNNVRGMQRVVAALLQ